MPPEGQVGDALHADLVEGEHVRDRRERQVDRQVVREPGAEDPLAGRPCALVQLGRRGLAEDRARMDEAGDRDRVLAGAVRAQAGGRHLGRRADTRIEDNVDVGTREDGVDVGGHGGAEPNVEPTRLAEIEALLGGAVDDPAAELDPRSDQPGLDDHLARAAGRPDRRTDLRHLDPSVRPSVEYASRRNRLSLTFT
jgi:hypothetical protein